MIIREYQGLDSENRYRPFVEVACDACNKVFHRQKRFLTLHTCSSGCRSVLMGNRVIVPCAHCGKSIQRAKSKLLSSRSGLIFCDRKCKEEGQKYIKEIQPPHYGTAKSASNYRERALAHYPKECHDCGYKENVAALVVHHLDHDRNNNELNNLRVLCANCHAITHWSSCHTTTHGGD